ncbi:hypothetical protein MTO96_029472 [Rhipicephalus appendiculatus]
MDMLLTILLTPLLAGLLWIATCFLNEYILRWRTPPGSKLPPMPPTTSMRGHAELLRHDFYRKKCIEWAKAYGPVIRLKVDFFNVVILNDIKSMKQFCNIPQLLWRSSTLITYSANRQESRLVGNVNTFLMAGTPSMVNTLLWQLLNFAKHPDTIQARVQREIDEVIGHERLPTWKDRKMMPYTLACVWEAERRHTAAPLGISKE